MKVATPDLECEDRLFSMIQRLDNDHTIYLCEWKKEAYKTGFSNPFYVLVKDGWVIKTSPPHAGNVKGAYSEFKASCLKDLEL